MGQPIRSEVEFGVDDAVDGLLAVPEGTQHELEGVGGGGLLQQPVDPVVVVLLGVEDVAAVDGGGVQPGEELQAAVVEGVDVGVADLALEGGVAEQQVHAVDVVARLRGVLLLGVVLPLELLQGLPELGAHVHHLHRHPHLLPVVLCMRRLVPRSNSSLRLVLALVAPFSTRLSGWLRLGRDLLASEGACRRSHSLGPWLSIHSGTARKQVQSLPARWQTPPSQLAPATERILQTPFSMCRGQDSRNCSLLSVSWILKCAPLCSLCSTRSSMSKSLELIFFSPFFPASFPTTGTRFFRKCSWLNLRSPLRAPRISPRSSSRPTFLSTGAQPAVSGLPLKMRKQLSSTLKAFLAWRLSRQRSMRKLCRKTTSPTRSESEKSSWWLLQRITCRKSAEDWSIILSFCVQSRLFSQRQTFEASTTSPMVVKSRSEASFFSTSLRSWATVCSAPLGILIDIFERAPSHLNQKDPPPSHNLHPLYLNMIGSLTAHFQKSQNKIIIHFTRPTPSPSSCYIDGHESINALLLYGGWEYIQHQSRGRVIVDTLLYIASEMEPYGSNRTSQPVTELNLTNDIRFSTAPDQLRNSTVPPANNNRLSATSTGQGHLSTPLHPQPPINPPQSFYPVQAQPTTQTPPVQSRFSKTQQPQQSEPLRYSQSQQQPVTQSPPQQPSHTQPAQHAQQQPQYGQQPQFIAQTTQQPQPQSSQRASEANQSLPSLKLGPVQEQGDSPKKTVPPPKPPIQKSNSSMNIRRVIKDGVFEQRLGNVDYAYSLFPKKRANFFGENERFLILKGIECVGYARELPPQTVLPFQSHEDLPELKGRYALNEIDKAMAQSDLLVLQFRDEGRSRWEFQCPNRDVARNWKMIVVERVKLLNEFRESPYARFEDYLRSKADRLEQPNSQINNRLMGMDPEAPLMKPPTMDGSQSQPETPPAPASSPEPTPPATFAQTSEKPFPPPPPPEPKVQPQTQPQQPKEAGSSKPTTFQFRGSTMMKMENFIVDTEPAVNQSTLLTMSMRSMPEEDRRHIRGEIDRLRRNWVEELLGGEEEVELIIEFRDYVHKVVEVVVREMYVSKELKIFKPEETSQDHARYELEDVTVELFFWREEYLEVKNPRYKAAAAQFKNMDYLLSATKNRGLLKVPFMVLFEYKGFVGVAKSKIPDGPSRNRQLYDLIDRKEFEESSRINADLLLDESKVRVLAYDKQTGLSKVPKAGNRAYFAQSLADFLPTLSEGKPLRPELVQDRQLEGLLFHDGARRVDSARILATQQAKIASLVGCLEQEEDYFTNSRELALLMHISGLGLRQLGAVLRACRYEWLRRIVRSEMAARSVKGFFRFDLQYCVTQQQDRIERREVQTQKEKERVVSFLNLLFGNSESTARLWRNVNLYSEGHFGARVFEKDHGELNVPYLLQALQSNLKIVLAPSVHSRLVFSSMETFQLGDFQGFEFEASIYSLEFTDTYQQIEDCLEEQTTQSFHELCEVLTQETSTRTPYLTLLKRLPLHDRINEYLLGFTSPEDSPDLYHRMANAFLPSRFLYESKLAEIKWLLKAGRVTEVDAPAQFVLEHGRRWLHDTHPLFTQVNRLLAEFFSDEGEHYQRAVGYAQASLNMQQRLFGGDSAAIWKDYFLLGKIHFINNNKEEALSSLVRSRKLIDPDNSPDPESLGQLSLMLAQCHLQRREHREAYQAAKELYQTIRGERDEQSMELILEAVRMMKQLLELNQEHDSYHHFVENDFSHIVGMYAESPALLKRVVRMVAVPYLKNVILQRSQSRAKILHVIEEVGKVRQTEKAGATYLRLRMREGAFPRNYLAYLKDIEGVVREIEVNQMLLRWQSFNRMSNETLLEKIGNSQINRGFELLATLTAVLSLLGKEVMEELSVMEK